MTQAEIEKAYKENKYRWATHKITTSQYFYQLKHIGFKPAFIKKELKDWYETGCLTDNEYMSFSKLYL